MYYCHIVDLCYVCRCFPQASKYIFCCTHGEQAGRILGRVDLANGDDQRNFIVTVYEYIP